MTLSLSDHIGNKAIDEADKPEDEKSHRSPKREWLEVLFNIVIAVSFSVTSPFQGFNMHIVASEDFQRNAIFSEDMLEMRLSASARNTDRVRDWGDHLMMPPM